MARLPRYAAPGMTQHVIQRGNNRSVICASPRDLRLLHEFLRTACERYGCHVHAYVFMTNHLHLLITPTTASGISRVLQTVGRRYAQWFNAVYDRTGHLWGGRYKATVIDSEQYLFACYRYIELNPVRAGMARNPRAYRWSSYRANALGAPDPLVTPHERYQMLAQDAADRQSAYRVLFAESLPDSTLAEIRDATNKGWALGNKRFRDEVAALLARRSEPAVRGRRPRKNDEIRV